MTSLPHLGVRVHVAALQRGADATAIGQLATQVPGFLGPPADRRRTLPETPKGAHPVKTEWAPFVRHTPYWLYGP